ncbi:hypothetical protein ACMFMF_003643 [Clarireedia jacksonii]
MARITYIILSIAGENFQAIYYWEIAVLHNPVASMPLNRNEPKSLVFRMRKTNQKHETRQLAFPVSYFGVNSSLCVSVQSFLHHISTKPRLRGNMPHKSYLKCKGPVI